MKLKPGNQVGWTVRGITYKGRIVSVFEKDSLEYIEVDVVWSSAANSKLVGTRQEILRRLIGN
jgi:hypothetical protein